MGRWCAMREHPNPSNFKPPTIFPAGEHRWNRNRKGTRSGEWGHVSITKLDKVLVTSDTSEIAVYGDCFGGRGPMPPLLIYRYTLECSNVPTGVAMNYLSGNYLNSCNADYKENEIKAILNYEMLYPYNSDQV